MPSGTGLYEDSDDESLSNELSPTNGYFNQRPNHPRDVLIPDPSQNRAEANKVREAEQERDASAVAEENTAPRRTPHFSTSSTSTRRRLDPEFEEDTHTEQSPLLPSAPPTYSAATAGNPYYPPRSSSYTNAIRRDNSQYNTMSTREVFLSNGPPEDLGGTPLLGLPDREEPAWKRKGRGYLPRDLRSVIKFLIVLAALALGITFIAKMVTGLGHHNGGATSPSNPKPGFDESPGIAPSSCPGAIYKCTANFRFDNPPDFAFIEVSRGMDWDDIKDYRQIHTSGELHVRVSNEHLESAVRVDLAMHYSDRMIVNNIQSKPNPAGLQIYTPFALPGRPGLSAQPCLYLVATMWIRPGARLGVLELQTETMSIIFHEGISLRANEIYVNSQAGLIEFPSGNRTKIDVNPRLIKIETRSGSVSGAFPLYDLLKISTQSGSIKVIVEPKDALPSKPVPAVLNLKTVSGSIHVDTPVLALEDKTLLASSVPARDYQADISSSSGSLHVGIIHGSKMHMQSSSGSVHAVLSPYGSLADNSYLQVIDGSGSVDVTVLSSISDPGKPMRKFYAEYRCSSASLKLHYPSEWEGIVEGETLSGSVKADWPGMRVISDGDRNGPYYSRKFRGLVGHGDSSLKFVCVSGSVRLFGAAGQTSQARPVGDSDPVEKPVVPPFGLPDGVRSPPQRWPGHDDEWLDELEEEEWLGLGDDWLDAIDNL